MRCRQLLQAGALLPLASRAQSPAWPARPVKLMVPLAPGGTTDVVSLLLAAELSRTLGQPRVVDNKPGAGAGTVIGVDAAARAPPDGHTLVTVAYSFCVNQTLVKSLPYDSQRDLQPVALMGLSEPVLAATPGAGLHTLADSAVAARRRPGQPAMPRSAMAPRSICRARCCKQRWAST